MRKNVEKLFNSEISSYKISKDTGITNSTVTRLRNGSSNIDDAKFIHVEKLNNYYLEKKNSGEIE